MNGSTLLVLEVWNPAATAGDGWAKVLIDRPLDLAHFSAGDRRWRLRPAEPDELPGTILFDGALMVGEARPR